MLAAVTVMAQLPVQGQTVTLRRAAAADIPAIVDLLAADQLGATRDHQQHVVMDRVDDPVVADPDAKTRTTLQRAGTWWARV